MAHREKQKAHISTWLSIIGWREYYLMRRAALCHDNVPRYTTNSDAVWIQKLTIMFPARAKVELEDSIAVKHLNMASSNCLITSFIYSTVLIYQSIKLPVVPLYC